MIKRGQVYEVEVGGEYLIVLALKKQEYDSWLCVILANTLHSHYPLGMVDTWTLDSEWTRIA